MPGFQRVITDWEAWNEEPVQDQSVGLPDLKDVNLSALKFSWVLLDPEYFDKWLLDVTRYLDSVGLKALISQTIPRPTHLNEESKKWAILSKQVAIWMTEMMEESLLEPIIDRQAVIYADSFVREAKAYVMEISEM